MSGNLARGFQNLHDAESAAGAEVVVSALRGVEGLFVRLREVEDMDVVTDAGAVRRIVVVSEEHGFFALALSDLKQNRDQVRFGVVVLAVLFRRAGGVEVAESGIFEPVDSAVPVQDLLKAELGFAVGVDGQLGSVFPDRNLLGLAEGGGGAGENKCFDSAFNSGIREVDRVREVVVEVLAGVLHGFADKRECGEVHDGFRTGINRLDMSGDQIVENCDFITSVEEIFGAGASDVSCSSGNKNAHVSASC